MKDVVRPGRRDDCSALYAIKIATHAGHIYQLLIPKESLAKFVSHYSWSPEGEKDFIDYLGRKFDNPLVRINILEREGRISGYLVAHQEKGYWNIDNVFVDPAAQGSGVGSKLLDDFLSPRMPICELRVIAGNNVAIGLYEKYGFKITDEEAGFFYGAPLVKMRRTIDIRII
jgi:ribosomal protein S18 acetylase RimI-like enzyme